MSENTNLRKTRVGNVVSTAMDKTIVVEYVARVPHPRFKKIVKKTKKFYAHDEESKAAVGDKVRITETKPISKKKCWVLSEILTH
jgi:small subunit ribosomal protein S17